MCLDYSNIKLVTIPFKREVGSDSCDQAWHHSFYNSSYSKMSVISFSGLISCVLALAYW